tara:strand:+ start:9049 stop:10149 length:1101 start_codon:yes stop_codon:yes gene_type:complete
MIKIMVFFFINEYNIMGIKVYCRVRDGNFNKMIQNNKGCNLHITHKNKKYDFELNKVWNNGETNEQIFEELIQTINNQFITYWVAFGYTGSGKTYTTVNLIRNLYNHILRGVKASLVRISAIQIYNDEIYDLLNDNIRLQYYKTKELVIKNIQKKQSDNIDEVLQIIEQNRTTAQTKLNQCSSRSHAIITIYYNKKRHIIVDMAGQETNSNINKNVEIQKQANNINLNMLALKECIQGLKEKKKYIPYRRTLLTLALRPMFEYNCNVSFICNVNLSQHLYYQLDSLRYASFLFKKKSKKDSMNDLLFKKYTSYIQDIGLHECDERMIWNDMKEGKFENIKGVEKILHKKRRSIDSMLNHVTSLPKI